MKWISHSRDEIKKGTICKRERIHICGLGASVEHECESEYLTPAAKVTDTIDKGFRVRLSAKSLLHLKNIV